MAKAKPTKVPVTKTQTVSAKATPKAPAKKVPAPTATQVPAKKTPAKSATKATEAVAAPAVPSAVAGKEESPFLQAFNRDDQKLIEWMMENPAKVIKERKAFMQQLLKRRCSYGSEGGILPITLTPMFLKEESLKLVADVGEMLDRALDKVVQAYSHDEYVRSYFPYPDVPKEWIEWDYKYKKPTVLSRHDALYDGKTLKFIEFNTDNPGGRGWHDTYDELFRQYPIYQDLIGKYAAPNERHMLKALKDALLSCYKEWGGKTPNPRVALVSFKQFLAGSDNEIVRDYLIEHGVEANFVDAREFEYRKGRLYSSNVAFDIINLTLRFTFFKRFPREMQDFLAALRDGAVCCVNPIRAIIGSHKEAMAFLTNEENHHYFTKEEAAAIKQYIPWTRKMDETITISKEGQDISLHSYVLKHQDQLVLKPTNGAGGYEVYVGKTTDKEKWAHAVGSAMGCPWWIVQEAVNIPEYDFPVIRDNKVVLEKKHLNINPYIFKGKYVGCLGRVSDSNVINVSSGGGIIPIFSLKDK